MKHITERILITVSAISLIYCFTQCKKEDETLSNIVLHNQPLNTIQKYIQGKWRVAYAKGGISSNYKEYCDDYSVEFTSTNKIISKSFAKTDGAVTIQWAREIGTYTNGEQTYLMEFSDKQGVPWVYVVDRIDHDTLIYHDNSVDAVFYHCVKSN